MRRYFWATEKFECRLFSTAEATQLPRCYFTTTLFTNTSCPSNLSKPSRSIGRKYIMTLIGARHAGEELHRNTGAVQLGIAADAVREKRLRTVGRRREVAQFVHVAIRPASADCYEPLGTMLLGGALVLFVFFIADRTYLRKARERAERSKRALFAVATAAALFATVYLCAFSQSCDRQALCGVQWDLNCSATNRAVFSAGQLVSLAVALLLIAAEKARVRRDNPM